MAPSRHYKVFNNRFRLHHLSARNTIQLSSHTMVDHDKNIKQGGEWVDDTYERTAAISSSAGENDRSGMFSRFKDSFKRADINNTYNLEDDEKGDIQPYELTNLKQTMKPRHVVMMSLGTGIGTGLLVANGMSLRNAGPAGLIIGYVFVSIAAYIMMHAAGEMAVAYPSLPGGYNAYSSIFISKPIGFATVWLYCVQWMTVLPLEIITSTLIIKYWTNSVSPALFVTIFLIFISGIHFFGARGYGEAEFIFNSCKVLMIAGFILLSILTIGGKVGTDKAIGNLYWHEPGPFYNGPPLTKLKGIAYVLVTGFFSYGGMELYALSVNELPNPRKAIPSACKKSAYRMVIVYVLTMILIGFLVPSDSDQLMGSHGGGGHASPFVLAMSLHGVKVVPHILNAVILISVISVGNSAMYSGSRLLCSLAQQGYAPRIFDYVDRSGRPLVALLACTVFGFLAYIAVSNKEEEVFQWLASLNGLSEVFTWTTICLSHYRFRKAMRAQGKPLDTVGYKSIAGEWGSLLVVIFNVIVLVAQFWVALFPIGSNGDADVESFFKAYLAFPLWIAMGLAYMIYNKDWTLLNPLHSIDLDAGRRIYDAEILKQEDTEYKTRIRHSGWTTKMIDFWC